MRRLEEIRKKIKETEEKPKLDREAQGRLGELIVEAWLSKHGLDVYPLPQDYGTKKLLLPNGGKRPDFAAAFFSKDTTAPNEMFFVDAKFHATGTDGIFSLEEQEINDFRKAMEYFKANVLFIALIPKEQVDRIYLIGLDEISEMNSFGPKGKFSLPSDESQKAQYLIGHTTKSEYDCSVSRLRGLGFQGDVPEYPSKN